MSMDFPAYPSDWDLIVKQVKKRDKYTCQKCLTKHPPHSKHLHVHHIIPISKGGNHNWVNLITLCARCHAKEHPHLQRYYSDESSRTFRRKRKSYRHRRRTPRRR